MQISMKSTSVAAPRGLRLGERRKRAEGCARHGRHAVEAHLWKRACIMQRRDEIPSNLRGTKDSFNEFVQRQIFSKKVVRFINPQPKPNPWFGRSKTLF